MNVLNETQAAEILAREVAEQLDQGIVPQGKVIFEGKIMERTAVAEIVDSRILEGRKSAYFDVQDSIQDYLSVGVARQKLRNNICFSLRNKLVGAARDVFWGMNAAAREVGTIENFNEFKCDLDVAENNAEYAHGLGYSEFGTGMKKVQALSALFNEWRAAAVADADALNMRDYEPLSLYEGLVSVMEPTSDDFEKGIIEARLDFNDEYGEHAMDVIAKAVKLKQPCPYGYDLDAYDAWKEVVENVRSKLEEQYEESRKRAVDIAPYLQAIIDEATRVPERVHFYDLDLQTQQALIEAVERSATKIPEQLKKDRRVSVSEMALQCVALRKLRTHLGEVLRDPRFA